MRLAQSDKLSAVEDCIKLRMGDKCSHTREAVGSANKIALVLEHPARTTHGTSTHTHTCTCAHTHKHITQLF